MYKLYSITFLLLFSHSIWASPDNPGTGELWLEESQGNGKVISALLMNSKVDISVTAMTAKVTLEQTFKNQSTEWVNARYLFPLPDDAAINAMDMIIDERTIRGIIKEKEAARQAFEQAKKEGKKAALLQSHRPNMFSINAANIPPGSEIKTRLVYLQTISFKDEKFSLTVPTTFTPRYIPGKPDLGDNESRTAMGWAKPTSQVPDADKITPPQFHTDGALNDHHIDIKIALNSGIQIEDIDSPLHDLQWVENNGQILISLRNQQELMDRDFTLHWKPAPYDIPQAAVFREDMNGESYTTLMLVPPQQRSSQRLPREVIFIIDTSGSMSGVSIRQARESLSLALTKLEATDFFNIIEFDDDTHSLFQESVVANKNNIQNANGFISQLNADGGTEMMPALLAAFSQPTIENYLRQIVFITDGSVGNETDLFEIITENLGDARLFTVSIGSAPNSFFMRKSAQFGRGTVTTIRSQSEVMDKITALFSQLENPILRDIQITWPGNVETEQYPQRIPDLYLGEPLVVHSKSGVTEGTIKITGELSNEEWSRNMAFPESTNIQGQATIWANKKIEHLIDSMITGTPEEQVKPEVTSLALKHKLVSSYTSFVAIEEQPSRSEHETSTDKVMANLMPKGSTMAVSFPGTATSATLNLYIGLILLLFSLIFMFFQKRPNFLLNTKQA